MSTAVLVPVDKYLNTSYRPDRDYIDGHLEKRNVGEFEHGDMQTALLRYLLDNAERFRVRTVAETRVRINASRYRIADVCCIRRRPEGRIITEPPVLVIEVLSRSDRFSRIQARISDFLAMGVPYLWTMNARNLDLAFICEPGKEPRAVTDGFSQPATSF